MNSLRCHGANNKGYLSIVNILNLNELNLWRSCLLGILVFRSICRFAFMSGCRFRCRLNIAYDRGA